MKSKNTYTGLTITALARDGNYNWLGLRDSSNNCHLYKVSVFDPSMIYFDVDVEGTGITSIIVENGRVYLTLEDDIYIAAYFSTSSPFTYYFYAEIPAGITEKAIDLATDTTYIYLLTPGVGSAENAKIIRMDMSLNYDFTIDLSKSGDIVEDAKKIDVDASINLYVVSQVDPPYLTKVFDISGGGFDFDSYELS